MRFEARLGKSFNCVLNSGTFADIIELYLEDGQTVSDKTSKGESI